mmetsp:Transcript_10841/g.29049  ORF Transcript_10841/g.29049 Transcript_10841/m.29049 type:complete len:100 (-) Transcript_10841:1113-1412(-)
MDRLPRLKAINRESSWQGKKIRAGQYKDRSPLRIMMRRSLPKVASFVDALDLKNICVDCVEVGFDQAEHSMAQGTASDVFGTQLTRYRDHEAIKSCGKE